MAVPLLSKGVLRGVLFCDTRERTNAFSEKDLKVLSGIASQAAIALENADLATKIERRRSPAPSCRASSRRPSPRRWCSGKVELLRVGRLAEVSCIFADIRGFTSMAEADSPQETVAMLNTFFPAMADGDLPERRQPRQVHRRLRDGDVGPAHSPRGRRGAGAEVRARDAGRDQRR